MMRRFFPSTIRGGNTAGQSFELVATPADLPWFGLAYGNGIWAAVADGGVNPAMSTVDGLTWTQQTATNVRWRDLCFSSDLGLFVATAITGTFRIMTSSNAIDWTNRTAASASNWFGIAAGNGYVVGCASGRIQWSTNGTSWTFVTIPAGDYRSVAYSPELNIWVTAGFGVIATATDPTGTWTARTGASGLGIIDLWWENGIFMGADFQSSINVGIRSTDGITWTVPTSLVSFTRNTVAFGNNLWFTGGGTAGVGRIDESTDGITWINEDAKLPATTGIIQRMRYADNKFVAVISTGTGNRALISQ